MRKKKYITLQSYLCTKRGKRENKEPVQLGGGRKEFLHLMMFELNF